jgi:hypothetical protein
MPGFLDSIQNNSEVLQSKKLTITEFVFEYEEAMEISTKILYPLPNCKTADVHNEILICMNTLKIKCSIGYPPVLAGETLIKSKSKQI